MSVDVAALAETLQLSYVTLGRSNAPPVWGARTLVAAFIQYGDAPWPAFSVAKEHAKLAMLVLA